MTFNSILRYVRDPRPHTGPMYVVMGLTIAAIAWRARREISTKEETENAHTQRHL